SAAVDLPEELVSGTAVYEEAEQDKYRSPGMVTVIRPQEREGEQRSLPDLLEDVPGMRIVRVRGRHGYAVASVRGSTSSQVAVYVDGVLMNLGSEAAVDLSAIPVDNVERIEVYRGYVPAQFGAQSMGGVINIVTKDPRKPQTTLSMGVGSFGRVKGTVSHSAEMGRGGKFFGSFGYEGYDGDFGYWNDNGTPYNDTDDYDAKRRSNGFENMDALLKWENEHWKARASWSRRDRDLALTAPGLDKPGVNQRPGALLDTDRFDLSLARSQTSGSVDWRWEIQYAKQERAYDSRRGNSLSPIGGMTVTKSEYDAERAGLSLSSAWAWGERHYMEFLAEYFDESLNVDGDTLFDYLNGISKYSRTDWNFNLQDTITLDRAGTFLATPSIRWHKLDDEDHFTWQIALTKEFSPAWMLKTTYGTYARAPNLYERYGDGAFILPAAGDLMWETGTQIDLGVIWTGDALGARSTVSLSGFKRDSENLIEFNVESPRYGRYSNIAKAEVKGAEMEASLGWEKWDLSLSGTWIDGKNMTPDDPGAVRYHGKTLPNRPEWSGAVRLTRKYSKGSAFVEYQHVGENYADSSEKVLFDARDVFNIGMKYALSPTTQVILGVDDVFGEADDWRMRPDGRNGPTRMLWYPVEGRTFYLTLNMEF
ncbi:MAG: TonB-dependent receptor, partial [Synergistaceae bacterium]|nr:TonB-dependent receptor [Synergistaceae bacterium]